MRLFGLLKLDMPDKFQELHYLILKLVLLRHEDIIEKIMSQRRQPQSPILFVFFIRSHPTAPVCSFFRRRRRIRSSVTRKTLSL